MKEACTVASNPEDHADVKRFWDKSFGEYNKEVALERTAPAEGKRGRVRIFKCRVTYGVTLLPAAHNES